MTTPAALRRAWLLLLLALPGCTKALINEAEKVQIRQHRVAEVTQAWVTEDGGLAVCARGWLANSTNTPRPEVFHFAVPLEPDGTLPESPDGTLPEPRDVAPGTLPASHITVPYKTIARGCPDKPETAIDVEVAVIPLDHPDRPGPGAGDIPAADWLGDGKGRKLWVLPDRPAPAAPAEPDPAGPAGGPNGRGASPDTAPTVVRREELPDAAILYRHDKAVIEGTRMAWIDPGEDSGRQRGLYVFLPVTLLLDAPFILLLGLIGADPF